MTGPDRWIVEGVLWCPRCDRYHDFYGSPQEVHDFIGAHHCTATATAKDQDR